MKSLKRFKKKSEKLVMWREELSVPMSLLYTRTYLYCHLSEEATFFLLLLFWSLLANGIFFSAFTLGVFTRIYFSAFTQVNLC